jgi:hypothetical protein
MEEISIAFDELSWSQGCLFDEAPYCSLYGDETHGWRPLFAFRGPDIDPLVNSHTVYFRRTSGQFEYKYIVSKFN